MTINYIEIRCILYFDNVMGNMKDDEYKDFILSYLLLCYFDLVYNS